MDDITELYDIISKLSLGATQIIDPLWSGTIEDMMLVFYGYSSMLNYLMTWNNGYLLQTGQELFPETIAMFKIVHQGLALRVVNILTTRLKEKDVEYANRIQWSIWN